MNTSTVRTMATMLVLIGICSGCQRSRMLSRNDYESMHDPFMDADSTIATASAPAAAAGEGVARVAPVSAARRSPAVALSGGPKPIDGTITSSSGRGEVPVARATYPSGSRFPMDAASQSRKYPGPSLSDFMSGEDDASKTGAKTEVATAELKDFARFVENTTPAPAGRTAPGATTSAMLPSDGESESSKLARLIAAEQEETSAVPAANGGSATAAAPSAAQSPNVFASLSADVFPATDSSNAAQPLGVTEPSAPPVTPSLAPQIAPAPQMAQAPQIAPAPQGSSTPAISPTENPFASLTPSSTTLSPPSPEPAAAPPSARQESLAASAAAESFENPFADLGEPDSQTATPAPSEVSTSSWTADGGVAAAQGGAGAFPSTDGLDSAFRMDTGWKPSHLVAK